jgi:hypothetical protein
MLTRPWLETLRRLVEADENLSACADDMDRVPAGGTVSKKGLKLAERIRESLANAQVAIHEATDLILVYSGAKVLNAYETFCLGQNGTLKLRQPK